MNGLLVFLLGTAFASLTTGAETHNFDSSAVGSVPSGWIIAMTHAGGSPKWEVLRDDSAPSRPNILAQTSTDRTSGRFPLAISPKSDFTNGILSVKFKPVSGSRDQAAGLVWRYKNPENYYIVRANALEDNVVLYKVENGKRSSIAPKGLATRTYGIKQSIPKQSWSALRVEVQKSLFTVYFNGKKLLVAEDTTFKGPGKTGLWTKADSVTYFDDFQVELK